MARRRRPAPPREAPARCARSAGSVNGRLRRSTTDLRVAPSRSRFRRSPRCTARCRPNSIRSLTPAIGTVLWSGFHSTGLQFVFVRTRCRRFGLTLDLVRATWTSAGPRQQFVATFGTLGRHSNCHRRLLEQARDRLARLPLSSAERAKAARALCATLRRCGHTIAHQFEMALAAYAADPKPRLASLHGCTVSQISRGVAHATIKYFEWVGTIGRARASNSLCLQQRLIAC